ncbi:MAG: hypothetical protein R3293_05875 [Candidatus Promineifilaceae bacterium]|nr:hypothetical protein [Candidatus Promineifilaceae bacterium]
MSLILEPLFCLIYLGLLLLFIMALLSPFEALGWWSGWAKKDIDPPADFPPRADLESRADFYVVYLTAIGGISAEDISGRERRFLSRLSEALPGEVSIVDDVYPFSVTNNPLNGERQLGWLWQRIHNSRRGGRGSALAGLIFIRNLLQVGVSGDPRYGPIYNVGVAREIARSLLRHGYPAGTGQAIAVMGWSGGGQIAAGVVPYLSKTLAAPINVISIGGVIADEPGVGFANHLYHIQGSRDKFPSISKILYPGRWPFASHSTWNQAVSNGKITLIDPGPIKHTGHEDYFDHKSTLPDGQSFLDKTVSVIADSLIAEAQAQKEDS